MKQRRVTITLDLTSFYDALDNVTAALRRFTRQVADTFNPATVRRVARAEARKQRGGNSRFTLTDEWQCGMCAGWLHESCLDVDGTLDCRCTCRGGDLR